jgi:mono/diheme cytochrome c family protein
MLAYLRGVIVLCLAVTPALAGDKASGPAVPGFARFFPGDKAKAAEGGQLVQGTLNCLQCHVAKTPNFDVESHRPAPILDTVGTRVKRSYLREFLGDPAKVKPGTTMPNLFAGLDDVDKKAKVEALVHLLASTGSPAPIRPDPKGINAGRDLFHKVGCVACHGTRDAKGDEEKLYPTSVPLGNLKAKYTLASLKAFLDNPHQTRPSGRMPGILSGKEVSDVANYLMQGTSGPASVGNMSYQYFEGAWQNLPDFAKLKPKATGQTADFDLNVARRLNDCALKFDGVLKIDQAGAYTFHVNSDDGSKLWIGSQLVVNNDGVHAPQLKSGKIKLAKGIHKLTVGVFNAGGGFELGVEIEGPGLGRQPLGPLVYLNEEAINPKKVVENDPDSFPLQPKLIAQGKELFVSMGCANCHQLNKETKRMNATGYEDLKAEGGCLSGKPKKGVPFYGLNAAQQMALKASLQKPDNVIPTQKSVVVQTMTYFNCYACHERDKVGGVEDDVKKHFTATFKEWGDEAAIPPSLTGVGSKLRPAYLQKILEQGSHDRNYMNTRMPKFGPLVKHLTDRFINLDGVEQAPKVAFNESVVKVKSAGRQMVGKNFNCTNCHNFGGVKTEGVQGIDMAIMTERLNREWFHNYLIDPTRYRAGTRMPSSFPKGESPLKNVLDGKANLQIEAIWIYLSDGKSATPPTGMNKASIPLIPVNEAIIYRNFIQGAGTRGIGVGYPEHAHLAFDANDMRLAMIWQGSFMDARRHWTGRGEGFEPPMGENILHLPQGVSFYILAKDDEAWPAGKAKDLSYKFQGYRLGEDQRPTFQYTFHDIKIDDFPNAIEVKGSPTIRRTLTLTTESPIDRLFYRAAVADKITAEKDGWYQIGAWRMRIETDAPSVIRRSGTNMELLVPVRFKGNGAKIVQEYVW